MFRACTSGNDSGRTAFGVWMLLGLLAAGIPCQADSIKTASKAALSANTAGGDSYTFWFPMRSPVVSADGRYIAFISKAPNLVPGQSAAGSDSWTAIFLYDRSTAKVTLVSHAASSATTVCNGLSRGPGISADGRYVVYWSSCPDVVPGQATTGYSVFLYDRVSGTNVLAGVMSSGLLLNVDDCAPVISADGRYVAFGTWESVPEANVQLYDRVTGGLTLVSHSASSPSVPANGMTRSPIISADGRYVAFFSDASNLTPSSMAGPNMIFLYDRNTNTNTLVTHRSDSATTPVNQQSEVMAISADGQYLAYTSYSQNLVAGQSDSNNVADAFLYDRTTGTSTLLSHAAGSPTTAANGYTTDVDISADGRFVVFNSYSSNLVAGQIDGSSTTDLFLYDRTAGTTMLVSHSTSSATRAADGSSDSPQISGDGRFLAFASKATNLVLGQGDVTGSFDVFRFDRLSRTTTLISHASDSGSTAGSNFSYDPYVSDDGGVAFTSRATNLDADVLDVNGSEDVFLFDPGSGEQLSSGDFFTLPPCRLLDTRQATALGAPAALSPQGLCGVPEEARALAVNVTVINPMGIGHLTLYPGNAALPLTSTINFAGGQTRSNSAIIPLASDGTVTLAVAPSIAGGGTVHMIVDVMGYFN